MTCDSWVAGQGGGFGAGGPGGHLQEENLPFAHAAGATFQTRRSALSLARDKTHVTQVYTLKDTVKEGYSHCDTLCRERYGM